EEGGLAGAVRADQADDLSRRDVERDAVERHDPAEAHADLAHAQERLCRLLQPIPPRFQYPETRHARTAAKRQAAFYLRLLSVSSDCRTMYRQAKHDASAPE